MLLLISFSFATMVLFCLAMEKHREQVTSVEFPRPVRHAFRPLAWILLSVTAYISIVLYGWSVGLSVFFGALTAAILPLILLLTYKAHWVLYIAIIFPVLVIIKYYIY